MKTARFKEVVAQRGRPELHLTWSAPSSDPGLQRAAKEHRVLTVYQQTRGAKKDHGVVGLEVAPHAQYLVFPKSLRAFAGRRIVGIQYDLLAEGVSAGGKLPAPRVRPRAAVRTRSPKDVPAEPTPLAAREPTEPPRVPEKLPRPVPEPEETDPVRREIQQAIADLKAGHPHKARRRLEAVLQQ